MGRLFRGMATAAAITLMAACSGGKTLTDPCEDGCKPVPGELQVSASTSFDDVGAVEFGNLVRLSGRAELSVTQTNGVPTAAYDSIVVVVNGLSQPYHQKFTSSPFSIDVLASPENATAQANVTGYWRAQGSGNKTTSGTVNAQTTFTVPEAPKSFIRTELQFHYGALGDGGVITGEIALPNGKRVTIANNLALIQPKDSIEAGIAMLDINGRMQSQRRWVNLQDGKVYNLEVTGPDNASYELMIGLTWSGRTQKWETPTAPVFIIDDTGHIDAAAGLWTRTMGVPSDKLLQSDDVADIVYFVQDVLPKASNYSSATFVLASTDSATANMFQGSPVNFPAGYVYNGTTDETNNAISHSDNVEAGILKWAANLKNPGVGLARSAWVSDLLESLGYNTNSSVVLEFVDNQTGAPKPLLNEATKLFYSPQRPAGSGRVNGFDDFINNQNSPDQPVGSMGFPVAMGALYVPAMPSYASVPQGVGHTASR